jgi:uncharacterized phage protein (TIGR02220 family)
MIIEVEDWEKYNPRKDVKSPAWFRLENNLFSNSLLYGLNHETILFFVYLLCQASTNNCAIFELSLPHLRQIGRFRTRNLAKNVKSLSDLGLISVGVSDANIEKHEKKPSTSARHLDATNERTNERTNDSTLSCVTSSQINLIVSYLNEKSGKAFKPTSGETAKLIRARIKQGFCEEDFKRVIDSRCDKWKFDPKMCEYIRPSTIFGNKFESYLNDAGPAEIAILDEIDTTSNLYKLCQGDNLEIH